MRWRRIACPTSCRTPSAPPTSNADLAQELFRQDRIVVRAPSVSTPPAPIGQAFERKEWIMAEMDTDAGRGMDDDGMSGGGTGSGGMGGGSGGMGGGSGSDDDMDDLDEVDDLEDEDDLDQTGTSGGGMGGGSSGGSIGGGSGMSGA
jgi:hypothetical protein